MTIANIGRVARDSVGLILRMMFPGDGVLSGIKRRRLGKGGPIRDEQNAFLLKKKYSFLELRGGYMYAAIGEIRPPRWVVLFGLRRANSRFFARRRRATREQDAITNTQSTEAETPIDRKSL